MGRAPPHTHTHIDNPFLQPAPPHPSFLSCFQFFLVRLVALVSPHCLRPTLFLGLLFSKSHYLFPALPPPRCGPSAALANGTEEEMKALALQWLCIWCRSGSRFMAIRAVIRVGPDKGLRSLMGLVWINYWGTHTSSVDVWGGGTSAPPTVVRSTWLKWFGSSDTAGAVAFYRMVEVALWC